MGTDIYDEVLRVLDLFPNVLTTGLHRTLGTNVHSYILFANEYGTQYDEGGVEPVSYAQLQPHLDAALFLATFPTGYDLHLRTLRRLAQTATAPIYLDYHILALGRDAVGTRYLKRRPNWLEWVSCAAFLQLNLFEAEHLAGRRLSDSGALHRFGERVLDAGPSVVTITLGAEGSFMTYRGLPGTICAHFAAIASNTIDPTGCGDVYSAAFIARYLETGNVEDAAQAANRAAALKASSSGLEFTAALCRECLNSTELLLGRTIDNAKMPSGRTSLQLKGVER